MLQRNLHQSRHCESVCGRLHSVLLLLALITYKLRQWALMPVCHDCHAHCHQVAALLDAGLMITTLVSYLSHSQIWALQEEAMLHVGGRTNRATIAFAGELSTILDSVPDRGSNQSSISSEQPQRSAALPGPLYIEVSSNKVKQASPGAGANRNPDYVPSDAAGNVNGGSIGFASLDDEN